MLRFGMPLQVEEVKAAGDSWEVSGYVSTFNDIDRGNDVVLPGAFAKTLADGHRVKFLHSHDPAKVLGAAKSLKEDRKGLFGTFGISKTQLGEETHTLLLDKALDSFSIGYIADEWGYTDKGDVRELKAVTLLECSLVAVPMNPAALVTAVKGFDLTLSQQAAGIRDEFDELARAIAALRGKGRELTETKRQELTELLATFAGLDAVRSDLQSLLTAPTDTSTQSIALRLALKRRQLAAKGILED